MPTPRVFISSTCYDLRYIRENLKFFTRTLGFEPVLSEEGNIFYNPSMHVQDACLVEVPTCQLFVLIIGGRYGARYRETEQSVTNAEYNEAVKARVPIFALVERSVHDQHRVYMFNRENPNVDASKISYPAVDSTKIFEFVEEVQGQSVNNALAPFSDFEDIQNYLKQQWSGMMFAFLTRDNEMHRVSDTLSELARMSDRIEFLSNQILRSVGSDTAKVTVELYDLMLQYEVVKDMLFFGVKPTPRDVLAHGSFNDCIAGLGQKLKVVAESLYTLSGPNLISEHRFNRASEEYNDMRERMTQLLGASAMSVKTYLEKEQALGGPPG